MKSLLRVLLDGLRVTLLLRPRLPLIPVAPALVIACAALDLGMDAGLQALFVASPRAFNSYGLQTFATGVVLNLLAAATIVALAGRPRLFWTNACLLFVSGTLVGTVIAISFPALWAILAHYRSGFPPAAYALAKQAEYALDAFWLLLIAARLTAALNPRAWWRIATAGVLTCAVVLLPWWHGLTQQWVWQAVRPAVAHAKPNETAKADDDATATEPDFDAEDVMYAQPRMMQDAIAKLAPQKPGKVDLYLIGFAGDGEENVFRNEVEYVDKLFAQRFAAQDHTLVLVNSPATLEQHPIASITNLETAIDAVAQKMDPDEDILLLFLTSHGSSSHKLYVALDPLPLDQIEPDDLADIFARAPIRWKVIVISACYSGGFVDSLKNATTMVITAARADRASFGCGTASAITDFGKAFFAQALNRNDSFPAAFEDAREQIDAWETSAGEDHSYPQIATTPLIEAKLKDWRAGFHLGPAVPFKPAAPTPDDDDAGSLTASALTRGNAAVAARVENSESTAGH